MDSTRPTPRITHVIYDLDGTLLDTEPIYVEVTNAFLGRYGITLDAEIRGEMMGRSAPEAISLLLEWCGIEMAVEDFVRERESALMERFARAAPLPGAKELTSHLARHGVPQAVATSSTLVTLEQKVRGHREWFEVFEAIISTEEVERGKPAPDIFLEAARRMGAPAESCLVFEDAPLGVAAACAAGMRVVAIPEPEYRERVDGAHEVLESLTDFDPAAWGLPGYAANGRS